MVNVFHYVSRSLRALNCVCVQICVRVQAFKAWVYQRRCLNFSQTRDKAQGPRGSKPRLITECELIVIQTLLLEVKMRHAGKINGKKLS